MQCSYRDHFSRVFGASENMPFSNREGNAIRSIVRNMIGLAVRPPLGKTVEGVIPPVDKPTVGLGTVLIMVSRWRIHADSRYTPLPRHI